ncbi:DNA polymerase III, alpha subunit [Deinococcus proteolyticus MRP]|uniref:DNA polymerase III subunit alpha n=1 Tax=Deinococcus proteolyticus (strain ATCC 35074 / DSM 20540 / JCM 6276 / NBRC 101906 / NCIMB 13154 / VKM Ac-1939 / CCM 2703 / MRP) TaxID=693977 RepID=F0RNF7_DEIPM|nr:DNA polymerase III subunit alpha [Deinococcus proteolyticus]ADY25259.1 DNA polymerase III, alpha subunit [Deinococcus proteolyticus MRP]
MTSPDSASATAAPHIHLPDGSCCAGGEKPKRFAHLHQHTQYSLLDGAAKLKDLLKWAKETSPEGSDAALAMTDHGNMHGAVHFYNYAQDAGVKPILGYEAYVVPGFGTRRDRTRGQDGEKGIYHLTLLARDFEGYQNLCRLSSRGYTEGYYYKPRIDHELLQEHSKGVIAFSGCLGSEVQQLLLMGRHDEAKERLLWYRDLFGENYYIEIQNHGLKEQDQNNPILRQWAQELGIGMVATNDGHYVKKEDATPHETLLAIQTKATLADENRFKFPCDEFYVKSLEEMQAALPVSDWGEEVFDNAANIADLCNVELPVGKKRVYQMPQLPIPEGRTMAEEMRVQTYAGMMRRYPAHATEALLRDYAARSLTELGADDAARVTARAGGCNPQECSVEALLTLLAFMGSEWEARGKAAKEKFTLYPALEKMEAEAEAGALPAYAHEDCRRASVQDSDTAIDPGTEEPSEETTRAHHRHALVILRRAEYELSVINNMGFPDYFLIVADYINWAKDQDISVGPGRGSGAGSLVAYAMRITNLDPLEFDLLFERFLNPDRISMPDFDIDFNDARRMEVVEYVQRKYGEDKVAQIATFGTMASKACLKDVARVMGVEYTKVDKVSKLIPVKFGKSYSLEQAREAVPDIAQMLEADTELRGAYEFAQKLEGLTRHASVHAAGVVIGREDLTNLVPIMRDTSGSGIVCQYDMKSVEDIGLIKMDFLGLRTLSFLDEARRILRESKGIEMDFDTVPFDDEATYELMSRGDTKGVFQLEGAGITDASRRLRPRRLADIIALSALYRPGPMENIPTYVRRHHGVEEVTYEDFPNSEKWLEPILRETYGIPVYQEQIMQIASDVAGYSLGGADLLRRAMGKKDAAEMTKQRQLFVEGAEGNGVPRDEANKLFDLLDAFANYGFNKSHSAAYGVITYQTAWLKANYPVEFMAALLTVERRDSDKVAEYISDARKMDVRVLPPDINRSSSDFAVAGEEIYFGLYAIKGLGEAAVLRILDERERAGHFESLANFCSRIDNKTCNRKALESLIKSGAFDAFGERRQLLESLDDALEDAAGTAKINQRAQAGMSMMFALDEVVEERPLRSGVPPFTELERLAAEKEALGLYISGHPLEQHEGLREAASCRIADLDSWFEVQPKKGKRQKAVLAGMIEGVQKKPTKSGGMMARFILADESGQIELVAFSRAYDRIEPKLVNDTPGLVIVELEAEDGGLRAIAEEIVSIEQLEDVPKVMYVNIDLESASPDAVGEFQSILDEHAGPMPTYLRLETPEQFVLYQLEHNMGSPDAIRALNSTFAWANAYLAYDQQTILGRFAPKPPAWMQRKQSGGGMQA